MEPDKWPAFRRQQTHRQFGMFWIALTLAACAYAQLSGQEVFQRCSPAVARVVAYDSNGQSVAQGSGFFISPDGLAVTNYHIIEKAQRVLILLENNASLAVESTIAIDKEGDLALVKVNGKGLPVITLSQSVLPEVGAEVFAIGNPEGLTNTLSGGLVSGIREAAQGIKIIQTTAPISPGSSGGPLIGVDGQAVGVTTAYLTQGQNLNFAVSSAHVLQLLERKRAQPTEKEEATTRWMYSPLPYEVMESEAVRSCQVRTEKDGIVTISTTTKPWEEADSEVAANPNSAIAYYRRGMTHKPYFYESDGEAPSFDKAERRRIADLTKALELNPEMADAYVQRGNIYSGISFGLATDKAKNLAAAIKDYSKAITLRPTSSYLYFKRGQTYLKNSDDPKRFEQAIPDMTKAIELAQDNQELFQALKARGQAYARCGQQNLAIVDFTKSIEQGGWQSYMNRGRCYLDMKKFEAAKADFDKLSELTDMRAFSERADALVGMKQYDAAIQEYSRLIPQGGHSEDACFHYAHYGKRADAFSLKEEWDAAIADYSKALEGLQNYVQRFDELTTGNVSDSVCRVGYLLRRANAYDEKKQCDLADADRERALKLCDQAVGAIRAKPDAEAARRWGADVYEARAEIWLHKKDRDKAKGDLEQCRKFGREPRPQLLEELRLLEASSKSK